MNLCLIIIYCLNVALLLVHKFTNILCKLQLISFILICQYHQYQNCHGLIFSDRQWGCTLYNGLYREGFIQKCFLFRLKVYRQRSHTLKDMYYVHLNHYVKMTRRLFFCAGQLLCIFLYRPVIIYFSLRASYYMKVCEGVPFYQLKENKRGAFIVRMVNMQNFAQKP